MNKVTSFYKENNDYSRFSSWAAGDQESYILCYMEGNGDNGTRTRQEAVEWLSVRRFYYHLYDFNGDGSFRLVVMGWTYPESIRSERQHAKTHGCI